MILQPAADFGSYRQSYDVPSLHSQVEALHEFSAARHLSGTVLQRAGATSSSWLRCKFHMISAGC